MKILFIDDERRRMDIFAMELELSGKEVIYCSEVQTGWDVFVNNQTKISLIILDIMMAPGNLFDKESSEDGLRTGILMFERIREQAAEIPVIIFTNVSDREVKNRFLLKKNCLFVQKKGYYPSEFVQMINRFLAGEKVNPE